MDITNYLDILQYNSLFKRFSRRELLELFSGSAHSLEKYKKNSIIHLQNEKCTTFDIILKGEVVVEKIDSNGNVLIVSSFSSGDTLGGNLIFAHNNTYPMTLVSKTDCIFLHIKKDLILKLCQKNEGFLVEFLQCISDKTLILTSKLKSITLKTIRQCIIEFLTYEYYYQKTPNIKLEITKKELAERLGVQRSSLSRELNKMRNDALIEFNSKSITIKDLSIVEDINLNS